MTALAREANKGLSLVGQTALVSGATQGIGAATAKRFAQAGASVYIIGRNESLGNAVVQKMKRSSPNDAQAHFGFIGADLSLTDGIKEACARVQKIEKGVNYFVQTQGMTPNGRYDETKEGIESRFAVQCLSKFGLAYTLLESGTITDSLLYVAAPGTSTKDFDGTDPSMKKAKANGKYGFFSSAARDSVVIDCITEEFASRHPQISFYHIFPGLVWTKAAANSGIPFPIPQLQALAAPIASKLIGNTPESFADVPVYLTSNPKAKKSITSRLLSGPSLKPIELSPWASDPKNRATIFQSMKALYGV